MSILRKHTRRGYTHIANDLIDAEGLSFRAKGIAVLLLSKPDDWEIKIPYLMKVGKEGEKAIRTALQELAEYGFLMRDRVRDADNKIRTITMIADYPAYINVGTVEERINGYKSKENAVSDIPLSDTSVASRSQKRQVRKGKVLINTDKPTTDFDSSKRKGKTKYSDPPPDAPRKRYSLWEED